MESRPEERISTQKVNGTLCGATSLRFGKESDRGVRDLGLKMEAKDFTGSIDIDPRYWFTFELGRSTRAATTEPLPVKQRLSYNVNLSTFPKWTF